MASSAAIRGVLSASITQLMRTVDLDLTGANALIELPLRPSSKDRLVYNRLLDGVTFCSRSERHAGAVGLKCFAPAISC